MHNYMKRSVLLLGAAALLSTNAMAEETWHNINYKVSNPAWLPGWSGCLTAVSEGVGETFNGAFNLYQVLPDMPAGEYKLSVNAFHRTADAWIAYDQHKAGDKGEAVIYLGTATAPVCSLFDHPNATDANLIDGDGNYVWGIVPNDLAAANLEFAAGRYLNTITYNHPGGDLIFGIKNPKWALNEWTAFDNFQLEGPDGAVTLVNGDFNEGVGQGNWDCLNIDGGDKKPDMNKGGGTFRKSNASPYNIGQTVTDLPAGKYRFSVVSFLRYGNGNTSGGYYPIKGAYEWTEGESAYDLHINGGENEEHNAYIYIYNNAANDPKETVKEYLIEDGIEYYETAIKCLFDVDPAYWVDNVPTPEHADLWCDSGYEYESSEVFVNHPEVFLNTVEIELTEPGNLTFGIKKDKNAPTQYWNPWTDMKLEYMTAENGVEGIAIDNSNAPVEYYNLQGLRVVEPTKGIYIVRKGTEVSKQVIRK